MAQLDSFLAWLSTTRAKSNVSASFLESHQLEIIKILGGMDNLLNIALSNKTFLSNKQFSSLSALFNKEIKRAKAAETKSATISPTSESMTKNDPITLLSLPSDLISYLCTFIDIKSLTSFEKCCYQTCFIARKPSSLSVIDHDIMQKINKYEQTQNNFNLDLHRFTKANKINITASKQKNHRFINEVIHKIAQSSMQRTTSINELYLNQLNADNTPFESYFDFDFSVNKLSIKDSDIPFILHKCFDVNHLELIDSAIDTKCIPFLFENRNRNNIRSIVFHDYRQTDEDSDIDQDIYLNENGLFLSEFKSINVSDFGGDKFESIQCEGSLDLTKYFLYNALKLSFNSLQSLHIEELNLLNIDNHGNIYENMVLSQLKELCFTCTVTNIKDDFVLDADCKYFETPNLERLNIEITSFTDKLEPTSNENGNFNICRYLKIFGIQKLQYLGINIEQNIDDDQSVLLLCLNGLMRYILKDQDGVCLADIIKLNISAEWFGEIDFDLLVEAIKNLISTVNENQKFKTFVLSIGDLYFDTNGSLMDDLRQVVFADLVDNTKWKILEQIELFGNTASKIIFRNSHEQDINWKSTCHCCERPAFI